MAPPDGSPSATCRCFEENPDVTFPITLPALPELAATAAACGLDVNQMSHGRSPVGIAAQQVNIDAMDNILAHMRTVHYPKHLIVPECFVMNEVRKQEVGAFLSEARYQMDDPDSVSVHFAVKAENDNQCFSLQESCRTSLRRHLLIENPTSNLFVCVAQLQGFLPQLMRDFLLCSVRLDDPPAAPPAGLPAGPAAPAGDARPRRPGEWCPWCEPAPPDSPPSFALGQTLAPLCPDDPTLDPNPRANAPLREVEPPAEAHHMTMEGQRKVYVSQHVAFLLSQMPQGLIFCG